MTYAQQFGAKVVQLEHRFYGMTNPFADLTVESLRFLSSEQVRAWLVSYVPSAIPW